MDHFAQRKSFIVCLLSKVTNHSGWDVGRLGAQGLYNICTPVSVANVKTGDLIFFTEIYGAGIPVSHVGIYVGDRIIMIFRVLAAV